MIRTSFFMRGDIIDRIDDEAALLQSPDIENGKTTASTFICEISALHQPATAASNKPHTHQSQPSAEASKPFPPPVAGVVCAERKAGAGSGHNGATVRSGKGTKRSHDVRQCGSA
jgi:hypothetical protein